jgi:hypothetical protein
MAQAAPLVHSGVIRRDQPVMFGKSRQRQGAFCRRVELEGARLLSVRPEYLSHIYNVRVHRTDGTRRLLLGESGRPPRIGRVIKIQIGRGKTLIAKIVAHPRLPGEPLEAAELQRASLGLDD